MENWNSVPILLDLSRNTNQGIFFQSRGHQSPNLCIALENSRLYFFSGKERGTPFPTSNRGTKIYRLGLPPSLWLPNDVVVLTSIHAHLGAQIRIFRQCKTKITIYLPTSKPHVLSFRWTIFAHKLVRHLSQHSEHSSENHIDQRQIKMVLTTRKQGRRRSNYRERGLFRITLTISTLHFTARVGVNLHRKYSRNTDYNGRRCRLKCFTALFMPHTRYN